MKFRELAREEISNVWMIERRERVDKIYYVRDGRLDLVDEPYDIQGWPNGESEHYEPLLVDCFNHGGYFIGAFEDDIFAGVGILENRFIGTNKDKLQLKFLHVSYGYRGRGLGRKLFDLCAAKAREKGANQLYISATPSENTINFYAHLGCIVTNDVDPDLFELEPWDIHLECPLD